MRMINQGRDGATGLRSVSSVERKRHQSLGYAFTFQSSIIQGFRVAGKCLTEGEATAAPPPPPPPPGRIGWIGNAAAISTNFPRIGSFSRFDGQSNLCQSYPNEANPSQSKPIQFPSNPPEANPIRSHLKSIQFSPMQNGIQQVRRIPGILEISNGPIWHRFPVLRIDLALFEGLSTRTPFVGICISKLPPAVWKFAPGFHFLLVAAIMAAVEGGGGAGFLFIVALFYSNKSIIYIYLFI